MIAGRLLRTQGRRRLAGALLVLAGLAIAATAILFGGQDAAAPAGGEPLVLRTASAPELGLAFSHPESWEREVEGRVFRLRSPDGSVLLTLASPVAGREDRRVRQTAERALREALDDAETLHRGRGRLGPRSVSSSELTGRDEDGARVRALLLVDSTASRTYAVTLITPGRPDAGVVAQAGRILQSVQLSEPGEAPGPEPR